jgi:tRNA(Ile)-lysidine synthetase-like protein
VTNFFSGGQETKPGFVVAVSGGCDSMVLLHLVQQVMPADQFVVAHFNHRVRGKESYDDECFVRSICNSRKLRLVVGWRQEDGEDSEESLREARRAFLEQVRKENQCEWIFTAHHLDDELETFLMRVVRGTGLKGLRGIRSRNGIWLRPLLSHSRRRLETFAKKQRLEFRNDATNTDTRYLRNRVRARLVPELDALAEQFGGTEKFRGRFRRMIKEIAAVERGHERLALAFIKKFCIQTPFFYKIPVDALKTLPRFLQSRLLHELLCRILQDGIDSKRVGKKTVCRNTVQQLFEVVKTGKSRTVMNALQARVSAGLLYLQVSGDKARKAREEALRNKILIIKKHLGSEIPGVIEIRFWQSGDRFKHTGEKLRDWHRRRGTPFPERSLMPVAVDAKGVVAVFPPIYETSCDVPILPLRPVPAPR